MNYERIIFKHELSPGETVVKVPIGAETLTAQVQDGTVVVWTCGPPTAEPGEERRFISVPTGQQVTLGPFARYVATVQIPTVIPLVFHIFEEKVY